MGIKRIVKDIEILLSSEEIREITKKSKEVIRIIRTCIKKNTDIFIGGSFAKGTILKDEKKDVDIFIRYPKTSEMDIDALEKKLSRVEGFELKKVHGSRDYFQLKETNGGEITFEIIPVLKIKSPRQAENVTDLSYFHVRYLKKKIKENSNLVKEILATKKFIKGCGVYGAESYIGGFSGYAVECLIVYFKTFEKFIRKIAQTKDGEKIIIDNERQYKNKKEIVIELNESKTRSPIILVDPTWKDRNVLAALKEESFVKLRDYAKKFIKSPNKNYFKENKKKQDNLKKKYPEQFLQIRIKTDRQEGDIAGTKLKKFSKFMLREMTKRFEIKKSDFEYDGKKESLLGIVFGDAKKIIRIGPDKKMKKHVEAFKMKNKKVFEKAGKLYSEIEPVKNPREFLLKWIKDNSVTIKDMDITECSIN